MDFSLQDLSILTGIRSVKGGKGTIKKVREEAAHELIDLQFIANPTKRRRNQSLQSSLNNGDVGYVITSEVRPLFRKDRLKVN